MKLILSFFLVLVLANIALAGDFENDTCENMAPLCLSDTLSFETGKTYNYAAKGAYYGCLYSTPSPHWFYMYIDEPGTLEYKMWGVADIDFIIWGPFPSISSAKAGCVTGFTADNKQDCSYATSSIEYGNFQALSK